MFPFPFNIELNKKLLPLICMLKSIKFNMKGITNYNSGS